MPPTEGIASHGDGGFPNAERHLSAVKTASSNVCRRDAGEEPLVGGRETGSFDLSEARDDRLLVAPPPARSTGATSSTASSTNTTGLPEVSTPGPSSAFNTFAVRDDPQLGRCATGLHHVLLEVTCKALVPSAAPTDLGPGKARTHLRHQVLGPFTLALPTLYGDLINYPRV